MLYILATSSVLFLSLVALYLRFRGPYILQKLFPQCSVKSVSPRSIRGIRVNHGQHVIEIDRIGLSLGRQPNSSSLLGFRCSIKATNVSCCLFEHELKTTTTPKIKPIVSRESSALRSKKSRFSIQNFSVLLNPTNDSVAPPLVILKRIAPSLARSIDGLLRPMFRILFVAVFRLVIRFLPTLMHAVDFELNDATVILPRADDFTVSVKQVRVAAHVEFSQLEGVIDDSSAEDAETTILRRLARMGNWRLRLKGSWGRTWNRAWGRTHVSTALSVQVGHMEGSVRPDLAPANNNPVIAMLPLVSVFKLDGVSTLKGSVSFIPRRTAFEEQSLDFSASFGALALDLDNALASSRRVADVLSSSRAITRERSATISDSATDTFSPPMSPMSPTSSSMNLRRFRERARKRGTLDFTQVFKGVDIRLPRFECAVNVNDETSTTHSRLCFEVLDTFLKCGVSHPESNRLHRNWLGNLPHQGKGQAIALETGFGATTLGWIKGVSNASIPLLTLDRFSASALSTSWTKAFRMDPNDSLLVAEATIDPLAVSGTMKDLHALERLSKKFKSSSPTRPALPRSPTTQIPRFSFDIHAKGCNILFCLDDHGPQSPNLAGVHIRMPESEFHGSSQFMHRSWARRDQAREAYSESTILMDAPYLFLFDLIGFVGSTDVQIIYADRVPVSQSSRHSVFRSAKIELSANGEMLAAMPEGADSATVDRTTLVARTRSITDSLAADLTSVEASSVILDLLIAHGLGRGPQEVSLDTQPIVTALPAGVSAHVAVGSISCLASGRDFAPTNTKLVKRGLEMRTSLVIDYCLMDDRQHSYRTRNERFTATQHRDRLQLREDILSEAISVSQELNSDAGERGAIIRVDVTSFQLRPIVDLGDAFAPLANWEPPTASSVPSLILGIPRMRIDMLLKRTFTSQTASFHDLCRVVMDVRRVRMNLSTHHAYCVALASTAFPRPSSSDLPSQPPAVSKSPIIVHANGQIGSIQVKVDLPGTQKAYLCIEKLKLVSQRHQHEVSLGVFYAWVLSADGKWDELLRLQRIEVLAPHENSSSIKLTGQSAKMKIPHEYSLASLIQEISLAAKTTKHLFHIVKSDHFIALETPPAEDAKRVPSISITLGSLVFEAADDPFETKLALAWRAGLKEQHERLVREEAFEAKVEAISMEARDSPEPIPSSHGLRDWHFGSKHTIPIEEARQRLHQFNSSAWITSHNTAKMAWAKREEVHYRRLGQPGGVIHLDFPVPLDIRSTESVPSLLRLIFDGVRLDIGRPAFAGDNPSALPEFLKRTGGLPLETEYTLLVPLSIHWEMRSAAATLRDYPLPLLQIRPNADQSPAWSASTDLVIAEEIGPSESVEWLPSIVVPDGVGLADQPGFTLLVPKTGMPVKTYANPVVRVMSSFPTNISWGVSYQPCVADVMRILESLTHPSRDPSAPLGFWDKIRMSLHGRLKISFTGDLNLIIKGSRDPYEITGAGAGFALCWTGNPGIYIGYHLEDKELIQFQGNQMIVGIPNLQGFVESRTGGTNTPSNPAPTISVTVPLSAGGERTHLQKICAKLTKGVKFGLGFVLERACDKECTKDHQNGPCRRFDFRPHHHIKLRPSTADPSIDSFAGFRSNFIHFSISLVSANGRDSTNYNSFHLSPKSFAHFFSWWNLFNPPNGPMLLPIRQGSLYPSDKPPPVKFTRHLATLKYRFSLSPVFISHVYRQDSRTSWATGITPCVGVKAVVESLQADLHQRDQMEITRDNVTGIVRQKAHKPFSAAEVVAKGLDLRAMLAHFSEPEKQIVNLPPVPNNEFDSSSSARPPMPNSSKESLSSRWFDIDDFVEIDWAPSDEEPDLWLFTAASCPRIMYFKKPDHPSAKSTSATTCSATENSVSRFGNEDTHVCFMGTELSAIQVQAALCLERLKMLEEELSDVISAKENAKVVRTPLANPQEEAKDEVLQAREKSLERKIDLLREHLDNLERAELHLAQHNGDNAPRVSKGSLSYSYPTEFEVDVDWSQFDNIYQIHCPQVYLNNYTRNILLDYYYSSRNRRGFEYHLSERAVRFIREQSPVSMNKPPRTSQESDHGPAPRNRAQAAAHTIRKIFTSEGGSRESATVEIPQPIRCQGKGEIEPASGWKTDNIVVNKSHLCLLLNPQFTLKSTVDTESILVITAAKASLQTFAILDKNYVDGYASDPINAHIMKRNYGSLSGLQIFSPSRTRGYTLKSTPYEVPLEVLLDLRCESNDFDRLVSQTEATLQYDKFNRLRLRNQVTSDTVAPAGEQGLNDHLQMQNDRVILNVDHLAVSANSQNFAAIYNIVSDLILYTDPDQRERNRQLQMYMYSYDFRDFMTSAHVVSQLQHRLRSLLEIETQQACKGLPLNEDRLMTRAQIFLVSEELNLIFKALRLVQEQDDNASDENKSNMRFDVSAKEVSWKMLEDTNDTLAKLSVRGIEYAWYSQKDSSAANKLVINDLQALDGSPDAVFPEMLVKYDKASSHPMVTKSLFAQAEWSILAPVGGIPIVNSFILDLHPIRLQIERKIGRKIMSYIFPQNASPDTGIKSSNGGTPRQSGGNAPGHKTQSSISAGIGAGMGVGLGVAGVPRASIDNTSLESASPRPRTLKKRATSHTNLKDSAALANNMGDDHAVGASRPIPRSRSSHALRADAQAAAITASSKTASRAALGRPGTADKEKEREKEKEAEVKDDANEMRVRASTNRTFVLVRVSGLVFVLSYKRDTPMSLTTVPDLDDFRFETPTFSYENETWSFQDMVEMLKKDIYKAAWAQKGALLREVFTKAKFITPKRFLPHEHRLPWNHKRGRGKTIRAPTAEEKGPEQHGKHSHADHSIDHLVDSMIASDSGLAFSQQTDNSSSSQSTFPASRDIARPSLSDSGPIGFPSDQEPSPTPRSIASSRASNSSQHMMDSPTRLSGDTSASVPYFSFPMTAPPSPPPMSLNGASSSRPARERVLSLFKKGKKKEAGSADMAERPRQSLDVPDLPSLPSPRQRTISAHAKMQQ
ncbi:Apt1 domain protein [Ceratobasidium sp. AG-Ba]|nr:Apt1 domain protein [Ceratobasidium sp. AG-Ba]